MNLIQYDVGDHVIAKTYMAPTSAGAISPGARGVIIERQEIVKRHKVRFENGREAWATSDQIKLDPALQRAKPAEEATVK
jgi:hypothetical protein